MRILGRYVRRLLWLRVIGVLFGLSALIILIDFLADGDQVLTAAGTDVVRPIARYVLLRLPDTLAIAIPIAGLIAGMLVYAELMIRHELTIVFMAAVSRARLMLTMLPAAAILGGLQFLVEDQGVPAAAAELRAWGIGDYRVLDPEAPAWTRVGPDLIRFRALSASEPTLSEVTIHRRDANGDVIEIIDAERAVFEGGQWRLQGVRRSVGAATEPEHLVTMPWPSGPSPRLLPEAGVVPDDRPSSELTRIIAQGGIGDRPLYVYQLSFYDRLAHPVVTILLILMGGALARPGSRRLRIGLFIVAGIVVGVLCWMLSQFMTSIGELGLLPPLYAAWAPALMTAIVAGMGMVYENPGGLWGR